jgi:diadenosine tetraphosphate (Ap4A) HIT family hydrolase
VSCFFCEQAGGELLWHDDKCRVILADEAGYPGFCRVVWQTHVAEMTDLTRSDRLHMMRVVFGVEQALRVSVRPDKINLASLGNMAPHLHWHIVARFKDDWHYPGTTWATKQRDSAVRRFPGLARQLEQALIATLATKTPAPPHETPCGY